MKEFFRVQNEPVGEAAIAELLRHAGPLPAMYLAFLRESNGTEYGIMDVGGDCLVLWGAEEAVEQNTASEVPNYLPSCYAIGTDGGDDVILLERSDISPESWPIIRVGLGSLDPEEFIQQAANFEEWAKSKFELTRDA
jgi:hypothetical protein